MTVTAPEGMEMCQGRDGYVLGKDSSPKGGGRRAAAQGCGHGPELSRNLWTILSVLWFDFWVLVCVAGTQ